MTLNPLNNLAPYLQDALPDDACAYYVAVYENAYAVYCDFWDDPLRVQRTAHRVAWAALTQQYYVNTFGEWVQKR